MLRTLASRGARVAAIALRLGRGYDAVVKRARHEGIVLAAFRPRLECERAELRQEQETQLE